MDTIQKLPQTIQNIYYQGTRLKSTHNQIIRSQELQIKTAYICNMLIFLMMIRVLLQQCFCGVITLLISHRFFNQFYLCKFNLFMRKIYNYLLMEEKTLHISRYLYDMVLFQKRLPFYYLYCTQRATEAASKQNYETKLCK